MAAFRIVIQWPALPEHKHALTTDQLNLYLGQTEVVPYYKLLPTRTVGYYKSGQRLYSSVAVATP